MSAHRRAVLLMLASAAFFTTNVLLVRALGTLAAANVWLISAARFAVGLALILFLYRREFRPRQLLTEVKLIDRGLLGGISVYLGYLAVVHLGAGRATFITNTYIIWGTIWAALVLHEKLRPAVLTGGVAAISGLALLTGVFSAGRPPGIYDLVAFVAALMSARIIVTIRQLHGTAHTATIFGALCVYGLLLCLGPAVATFEPISPGAWAVLLAASLCAGFAQLAMTRAYRDLSVGEGSLLQSLVPLGIALGGVVFFGERFTPAELLGAGLILAGTLFTALRREEKPTPQVTE